MSFNTFENGFQKPLNTFSNFQKQRKHPVLKGELLPERNIEQFLPPRTLATVRYYSESLGVDIGAALLTALSAISSSTQGVADVETPGQWVEPTSGMYCLVMSSGGKKNPLQKAFFGPLREMEDELLEKRFGDQFKSQDNKRYLIYLKHITNTALLKILKIVGNCTLLNTETGALFSKWGPDELATINDAYDGETLIDAKDGANAHNFKHEGARLSMFLAVPTKVFKKFLKTRKGEYWQDVGVFNRSIIYVQDEDHVSAEERPNLIAPPEVEQFKARLKELNFMAFTPGYERKPIKFDSQAKELDKKIRSEVREFSQPGGYLHGVKDHAAKMMGQVYRNAVKLHLSEGCDGDVSADLLYSAYQTALYFADYQVAMFSKYPDGLIDACEVEFELLQGMRERSQRWTPEGRYIYTEKFKKALPSNLSKGARFDDFITRLEERRSIAVVTGKFVDKGSWKNYIDLFPGDPHVTGGRFIIKEENKWSF